jgi:hypothetical protein
MFVQVNFYGDDFDHILCQVNDLIEDLCHNFEAGDLDVWVDRRPECIMAYVGSPYGDVWEGKVTSSTLTFVAISSVGNALKVFCDLESQVATVFYEGRRHALRDPGNNAGALFHSLFGREEGAVDTPGGLILFPDEAILRRGQIIEYRTARPDAEWWDCDLKPPKFPAPRFRTMKEFRWWRSSLPDHIPAGLIEEAVRDHLLVDPVARWNICGPTNGDLSVVVAQAAKMLVF